MDHKPAGHAVRIERRFALTEEQTSIRPIDHGDLKEMQ